MNEVINRAEPESASYTTTCIAVIVIKLKNIETIFSNIASKVRGAGISVSNVASCLPSTCQDQHRDCRSAHNQSCQYQQSVVVFCEASQDSTAS